jgi:hypothetical protein
MTRFPVLDESTGPTVLMDVAFQWRIYCLIQQDHRLAIRLVEPVDQIARKPMMKNQSAVLEAILPYLGIIYFTAWSVSFYPQLLLNFRRKR